MKTTLTGFWAWFFDLIYGGSSPGVGEGRLWTLEWTPPCPYATTITLLLILIAVVYVGVIYFLERGGTTWQRIVLPLLRLGLFALVLFMLFQPTLSRVRSVLPDVVVLLDDSQSMSVVDQYDNERIRAALERRLEEIDLPELSRVNLVKSILLEKDGRLLSELDKRYNLKVFRVGDSLRTLAGETISPLQATSELASSDSASRLGKCLRDVLQKQRGRPTAAVVVLTDGITTEGQSLAEVAETARRKNLPLYIAGLGNDQPLRDVWVSDLLVDHVVFVGDIVSFRFKISSNGFEGRPIEVLLREKGQKKVLARTTIKAGPDGVRQSGQITYRPEKQGEFDYEVMIVSHEGESKTDNNSQNQLVRVRDDTIRVLLVQAYPSHEFLFLKRALARQLKAAGGETAKAIELTTVLQEADPENAEQDENADRVFPVRRKDLFGYDVVIFGDVNRTFLSDSQLQNLADFVEERGGGVVFFAGPRFQPAQYLASPLAKLFPFNLDTTRIPSPDEPLTVDYAVQPTSLGWASPHIQLGDTPIETRRIWQTLPRLYWLLEATDMKPGARVLAEHPTRTGSDGRLLPVISMQFVGAGKVVYHHTDETWRWRFRAEDRYFGRYWLQLVRYLSRSNQLGTDRAAELTADRQTFRQGEPVRLRVRFLHDHVAPARDDGVTVVLEQDGGKNRRVQLRRSGGRGIFEATVSNLAEGRYHAWVAAPTLEGGAPAADFLVEAPPGEWAQLQMDRRDLEQAARRSGGKYFGNEIVTDDTNSQTGELRLVTADAILKSLPRGRQVPIGTLDDPIPLWRSNLIASLFLALLIGEWLLRKRAGML